MSTVYLGRDNPLRLELEQDGAHVEAGAVTRAVLYMMRGPVFDTQTDDDIEIDGDEIVVRAGMRDITPRIYTALLTVFDEANPNGVAWAELSVRVRDWPIE